MSYARRSWACRVTVLCALFGAPAFAESTSQSAALSAEKAYQDVDFPNTREEAERALEFGRGTPEQTARLHVLLGISAATLGDPEDAKRHFVAALAVDPSLRLEKILSPKIRDPYMEAEGYWSAAGDRLGLDAKPSSDDEHLLVRLRDPASLVSKVELLVSAPGARVRSPFTLRPNALTRFQIPGRLSGHDYEYVLRALDRYGNVLSERGSDLDPHLVRRTSVADRRSSPGERPSLQSGRSYALPFTLALTGLGAIGGGVAFNLRRERAAQDWNGPRCENPGSTRGQQCQSVHSRIDSSEKLAIGMYAGGAALIAGSAALLLLGGSRYESEHARGLNCNLAGAFILCLGQF